MKFHYFVLVVIWIATVTATSESNSHGNWSNEKELLKEGYKPEAINSQLKGEIKKTEDQSLSTTNPKERIFTSSQNDQFTNKENYEAEPVNPADNNEDPKVYESQQQPEQVVQPYVLSLKSSSTQETHNLNDSLNNSSKSTKVNDTIVVEHIPSQEIPVQESGVIDNYGTIQENSSNELRQLISEGVLDLEVIGDFGQRIRSSSSHKKNRIRQPFNVSSSSENYRKVHKKNIRSQSLKKLNNSDSSSGIRAKERLPFTLIKFTESGKVSGHKEFDGQYTENVPTTKIDSLSTSGSVAPISLGKFSGPIVVADLPRQRKYSYTAADYGEMNEAPVSPPAAEENTREKISGKSYLAASQVVLNPLQVGVALMNAEQDINSVDSQITFTSDKTDPTKSVKGVDKESSVQNDSPDSRNSSFPNDALSQGDHISDVVAPSSPVKSVEIQKSVEIFHTAPVQEIHYPMEYIPNVQRPLVKQRLQEDHRKPYRAHFKDRRPGQSNIHRYNEFEDAGILSSNQDRNRYKLHENDVAVEQGPFVVRPAEIKPVFETPEQVDNEEYVQAIGKHTKTQRTPDYESPKGSSSAIIQSTRLIDSLSSLVNLDNHQDTQEVPRVLLNKNVNEVSSNEQRSSLPIPQPYPLENPPNAHPVDLGEKRIPIQVEKIIEKQVTIPQPFPVHVPVDRVVEKQIRIPYPVHVEKVVEKKVPVAIQRFIIPLPIHFRIPQPIPVHVEKIMEKPVSIPVPIEMNVPRPYLELEKNRPYSLENAKLVKTGPIYNVQLDGNYQPGQVVRQNYQAPMGTIYGTENEQNYYNSSGQFYGAGYLALSRPFVRQPVIHTLPKKFGSYSIIQYPQSVSYILNGNNGNYGRAEKDKIKDEYVGPVPRKVQQSSIQSKSLYSSPDMQTTLRRTRQEVGNTGSFRQSKMEYGFKPPMVPSVQYDEETASKVN